MKTLYLIIALLLISIKAIAQNGINYKAIVKDSNGNIVANQSISILVSLEVATAVIYREEHIIATDNNGIAIVVIGTGNVQTGDFNDINWKFETPDFNIQVDIGNGYVDFGVTEFQAVPYALTTLRPDGLELLIEGGNSGWRLAGSNPNYYGNIGENAIDLSYNNTSLLGFGATGLNSFASGFLNTTSGDYATSFGAANEASGSYSTTMGRNTEAIGSYSTSLGYFSNAIGDASTAMGSTIASGDYSTSMGYLNEASGEASIAMGTSTIASGDSAISMGRNTEATGDDSSAFGRLTEASGLQSVTFGFDTHASNNNAFATGRSTQATGPHSTAMGLDTRATSTAAFAAGQGSYASGNYSTALGSFSHASGDSSLAFGTSSFADENHAVAIGQETVALGINATSIGYASNTTGRESLAIGRGLIAQGYAQVVIGTFNEPIGTYPNPGQTPYSNEPAFIVGNGSSENFRRNALTVLFNNNVGIGTSTPQERLHINGRLRIGTETIEDTGSNRLSFNADLLPDVDNVMRLGNSSFHWTGVWATDGTINTSDRRSKTNIANLNYGLKDVMKLKPVSFNWKTNPNDDTKLGLIAQDLLKVIPEVVKTHDWETDENGNKIKKELERMGVFYSDLVPVLIKAIQEQQTEIETLKTSQKKYEALLSRIEQLELKTSN